MPTLQQGIAKRSLRRLRMFLKKLRLGWPNNNPSSRRRVGVHNASAIDLRYQDAAGLVGVASVPVLSF